MRFDHSLSHYDFLFISDSLDRARLELRDTLSVTSGDPEGTISSLASGGKLVLLQAGEDALDKVLSNGGDVDNGHGTPVRVFSPVPYADMVVSHDNIPKNSESKERKVDSENGLLNLKTAAFTADSAENSSCGSFQDTSVSNGIINFDRNFSMSPPMKDANNLEFLNPGFQVSKNSSSPSSLTGDSPGNSNMSELGQENTGEVVTTSDKVCDTSIAVMDSQHIGNGNS